MAIAQALANVVGHRHHRAALGRQLPAQLPGFQLAADVQVGGGLVQEHHRAVLAQEHGQVNLLPLAAREPLQGPVRQLQDAHPGQGRLRQGLLRRAVAPGIGQVGEAPVEHQPSGGDVRHVPALGQGGQQLRPAGGAVRGHVLAVQEHPAFQGRQQTAQGPQQRAFAAAVAPQQHRNLPRAEGAGKVLHHHPAAVARAEVFRLQSCVAHAPRLRISSPRKNGAPRAESRMPTGSS